MDEDEQIYFEFLINNFTWTASTIEEQYKRHWASSPFQGNQSTPENQVVQWDQAWMQYWYKFEQHWSLYCIWNHSNSRRNTNGIFQIWLNSSDRSFLSKSIFNFGFNSRFWMTMKLDLQTSLYKYYTNVIYKTGQFFRNQTAVNADGYKCLVQYGEAKLGLLHLSKRY